MKKYTYLDFKKYFITTIFLWLIFFPFQTLSANTDFVYPFAEIAKSSCRKEAWRTLGPECKMPLPRISWAEYTKFANDTAMRRVYTVVWGATYDYGWDIGLGSHLGVDIATSAGTPVQSIGDGRVLAAGFSSGWGNYVTIEHTLSDGTRIWSNYAHLSALSVTKGANVTKAQKIGEVGNTGNSYGNHLHFQIDITDQLHPYYYVRCGAGKNPITIVNNWDCRSFLTANTIDPVMFLETGMRTPTTSPGSPSNQAPANPTAATIEEIKSKPPIVIERTKIKSREELLEEEALEYLRNYRITVKLPDAGTVVRSGTPIIFEVESRDLIGNLVNTNLPGPGITIAYDTSKVSVFPEKVNILNGGKRAMSISPRATGETEVTFMYGRTFVGKKKITVVGKTEVLNANKVEVRSARSLTLGGESDLYISPLSPSGAYIGANNYPQKFKLEITRGKWKFCKVLPKKWSSCDSASVVESLEFGANNTPLGYLSTRLIALSPGELEFRVFVRWIDAQWILINTKKITVKHPLALTRSYQYYDAVIASMGRNIIKNSGGYVGAEQGLTTSTAGDMIDRALAWKILRAGNDSFRKKRAIDDRVRYKNILTAVPERSISRGEFANMLMDALRVPPIKWDPVWNDESGTYLEVMTTLRTKFSFKWQDNFWLTYFQPDKIITRGEAAYMIEVVLGS